MSHTATTDPTTIPTGATVYIEGAVLHGTDLCPLIDGPIETGTYPERTGFVCRCADKVFGLVWTSADLAYAEARAAGESGNEDAPEHRGTPGTGAPRPSNAASDKQQAFIRSLIAERPGTDLASLANEVDTRGERVNTGDVDAFVASLTKRDASRVIEVLKARPVTAATPANAASDKQMAFLRRLLAEKQPEADVDAVIAGLSESGSLTKRVVSKMIDALLKVETPKAPATPAAKPATGGTVGEGFYVADDGTYVKVQQNRAKTNTYAKTWDGSGWQYAGKAPMRGLTEAHRMSPEQAKAFGDLYGRCIACSATLTDEDSIARGMGPICARKAFG